jgi:small subunit ribosomal protein S9
MIKDYCFGIGRRKTAVAIVYLYPGTGLISINNESSKAYLQKNHISLINIISVLNFVKLPRVYDIKIKVNGGGLNGQVDAIKLGLSKALFSLNSDYQKQLKEQNLLTQDSRIKERKKYGLKKARKSPQFSKR